ncbi:acrosin-like [Rhineura floridana]|uniref:acrosin-like n=1 Tax=Rhineura floridana TaxID=261503 RepID=UPI002AC83CEA|nr:acrosin-like [Rhineura floridana]
MVVCGSRPLAMSHGNSLRIVGGSSVLPGTWPWVVSFQFPTREGYRHFCAGSLINARWVLSSAHCFVIQRFLKVDYLRVQIGVTQRSNPGQDAQMRSIKRLVDHEHFSHNGYLNDISLIELDQPVLCNDFIQPACLPDENLNLESLSHCYTCGWGITEIKWRAEYADILQEAKVMVMPNKICNSSDWYHTRIREENICVISNEAKIDRCKGDGGSPLMCRLRRSERFWVVGLNSWGSGCTVGKVPGIFTATQNFYYWIQRILKNPPESALVPPFKPTTPTTPPTTRLTSPFVPPAWATAKNLARPTYGLVNGVYFGYGGKARPTYSFERPGYSPTTARPRSTWGWYTGPKRTFPPYSPTPYRPTPSRYYSTTKFLGWNVGPSIIYRLPRRKTTAKPQIQWQYSVWTRPNYWATRRP